jgi:tetratricopeptide (TPR) repeat protein
MVPCGSFPAARCGILSFGTQKKGIGMKRLLAMIFLICAWFGSQGQEADKHILKGNRTYQAGDFDRAAAEFDKALVRTPRNPVARYNLGNAQYRAKRPEDAISSYEQAMADAADQRMKADAAYNKGVVLSSQKKLAESIEAYKQALRINPTDSFARENLVRALRELKQQKQQEQDNQKKKQQEEKQQQQPKMNKQQVQQLLQALQDQERQLQQKMQKMKVPSPSQPEKDW